MTEIRFTKDKNGKTIAHRWSKGARRWIKIGVDNARFQIACGEAIELKAGQWI